MSVPPPSMAYSPYPYAIIATPPVGIPPMMAPITPPPPLIPPPLPQMPHKAAPAASEIQEVKAISKIGGEDYKGTLSDNCKKSDELHAEEKPSPLTITTTKTILSTTSPACSPESLSSGGHGGPPHQKFNAKLSSGNSSCASSPKRPRMIQGKSPTPPLVIASAATTNYNNRNWHRSASPVKAMEAAVSKGPSSQLGPANNRNSNFQYQSRPPRTFYSNQYGGNQDGHRRMQQHTQPYRGYNRRQGGQANSQHPSYTDDNSAPY